VHLIRAGKGEEPAGYAEAFDLLNRVANNEATAPQVLFNRALVLKSLGLRQEARRAAREFALSSSPDWAQQTASLVDLKPLFTGNDPASRRARAEALLGKWGTLKNTGQTIAAVENLLEAKQVAQGLANEVGDRLLVDAIMTIELAGDARLQKRLALGHALFYRARGSHIYSDCEMISSLRQAQANLSESPFKAWVHLDQAICGYFEKDYAFSEVQLEKIRGNAANTAYSSLQGRMYWIYGLVLLRQGRFADAQESIRAGIRYFEKAGELGHKVVLTSLLARTFEGVGAAAEAWQHRQKALASLPEVKDTQRRYDILEESFIAARRQKRPHLALHFLQEQLKTVEAGAQQGENVDDLVAYILIQKASLHADMDQGADALASLELADDYWRRLTPHHESRRRQRLDIDLGRSQLNGLPPRFVLQAIDNSLEFYAGPASNAGDRLHVLRLLSLRAQWHQKSGDIDSAKDDFKQGLLEVNRQRRLAILPLEQAYYLAAQRQFVEKKIKFEIDVLKDPWMALFTSEVATQKQNSTVLTNQVQVLLTSPFSFQARVSRLPLAGILIRYFQLTDELLIWTLRDGLLGLERRSLRDSHLRDLINDCRNSINTAQSTAEAVKNCEGLATAILPKVLDDLPKETLIRIVPDANTHGVPFALLPLANGRSLLISHPIVTVPALSWLAVRFSERRPPKLDVLKRPVFVCTPTHSKFAFPRLPALAQASCPYLPAGAVLLQREEASLPQVLKHFQQATYFQFDGHAIPDPDNPLETALVLAPNGADGDRRTMLMNSSVISSIRAPALSLVFLNACDSAGVENRYGFEFADLATSFLASNAESVVATIWPVDNAAAAATSSYVLAAIQKGEHGVDSIRKIQLSMKDSSTSLSRPSNWAAYISLSVSSDN
jgi:CHAT domain-containing protein